MAGICKSAPTEKWSEIKSWAETERTLHPGEQIIRARINDVTAKESYKTAYPNLFEGLGALPGEYRIELQPDTQPFALNTSRHVPLPLRLAVKEELNRMQQLGVISPVDSPTDWCAGMVVVPKPGGKVRICVDLTKLNESVKRKKHPLPTVELTLSQISGAKVFSKLDANAGFWQIPLAEESKQLTTFITPNRRFFFTRLPFGIFSAPEHNQKRKSSLLEGLPRVVCQMDDVLIYGPNQETHDRRVHIALQKLAAAGVTLNPAIRQFSLSRVPFLGQMVSAEGVQADPMKLEAILKMAAPDNVGEVRRLLGMVKQLGKFCDHLADETKLPRDLLKIANEWIWGLTQQCAFQKVKEVLTTDAILEHYDPKLPTKVSADASSYGLGAVLLQKRKEWRPVSFASRAMTDVEQRYALIEKEALASTWACERFSDYRLPGGTQIPARDRPQATSATPERSKGSGRAPTPPPMLSHADDALRIHHHSCSRTRPLHSRCPFTCTSRKTKLCRHPNGKRYRCFRPDSCRGTTCLADTTTENPRSTASRSNVQ